MSVLADPASELRTVAAMARLRERHCQFGLHPRARKGEDVSDFLDELERLNAERTKGEYSVSLGSENDPRPYIFADSALVAKAYRHGPLSQQQGEANAAFIAYVATHMPEILSRLKAAEEMCELLAQAERLYSKRGLLANDPLCGAWINNTRDALNAAALRLGATE